MTDPAKGSCLCGAVTYSATPKSNKFGACHCGMCRKWGAGPFLEVDLQPGGLKIEDRTQLGVYKSSDWAERLFCKVCGSSLFFHFVPKDTYSVSLDSLDDTAAFEFDQQIFVEDRHGGYSFAEETKMITGEELIAAFQSAESTS